MKRYAPISLTIVFVLYFLANIAYFAASKCTPFKSGFLYFIYHTVPKEAIATSRELTASLFFTAVFGNSKAVTAMSALVAVSSFGNLLAVIIGSSRIIRECGRSVINQIKYTGLYAHATLQAGSFTIPHFLGVYATFQYPPWSIPA